MPWVVTFRYLFSKISCQEVQTSLVITMLNNLAPLIGLHIAHGSGPKRDLVTEEFNGNEDANDCHVGYSNASEAAKRRHALLHGLLNKRHASAYALCGPPISWGREFYSFGEHRYCHMGTKTIYPVCASVEWTECFHPRIDEIQETRCARDQLCKRAEGKVCL